KIPARIPAVPEPTAQEDYPSIDVITNAFTGVVHSSPDFLGEFRRDPLVAIDDEDPRVLERDVGQGPVFFLRPAWHVVELHQFGTGRFRNAGALILRMAIDDPDLITESKARKACGYIRLFIEHGHERAHGDLVPAHSNKLHVEKGVKLLAFAHNFLLSLGR